MMSKADELFRRALKDLEEGLRPIRKVELIDEIRTYLATADVAEEPIAWIPEDELPERYPYNFMFQYSKVDIIRWFPIYGPPRPEPARKPTQDEEPKTHEPWCAYLTQMLMSNPPQRSKCNCKNTTAPRPEFVRLSEEEVTEILTSAYDMYSTICAVENRLAEKNHPPKPEPARKPMMEEEIKAEIKRRGYDLYDGAVFLYGIRFAEKHHQIGINKSDPDSIDLQSRCRGDKL